MEKQDSVSAGQLVMCETLRAFKRAGHTPPKIARELASIAYSDITDYVTVAEGGEVKTIPTSDISKRKRKAIKKIKEKRRILNSAGKDDDVILDQTTEYELYDKMDALRLVTEVLGIKKPAKVEHSGAIDMRSMPDDELDARIEQAIRKLNGK